ncbi:MAG: sulfite exporter TauE/SafE family protein [Candidatus Thorarchaeota archaeon]
MPLGEEFVFLALILGMIIGIISSIVGIGGGILFIPTAIFLFGFTQKQAVVISLFSMTGLNISASIRYIKMKLVNYRLAILYNIWDFPGVFIGAWITTLITGNVLSGICGAIIISLGILLLRRRNSSSSKQNNSINLEKENTFQIPVENKRSKKYGVNNPVIASLSSFTGGLISGLGGVGGGTTDTTTMVLLGVNPKVAAATSEFAMFFTSVIGVIAHTLFGTYNGSLLWPLIMTLGAIIGAQIGPYLSTKVKSKIIRKIIAIFALYTGILLILLMLNIGWIE